MSGKKPPKLLPLPKELTRSGAIVPSPRSGKGVVIAPAVRSTNKRVTRTKVVSSAPGGKQPSSASGDWNWKRLERIERNAVVDTVIHKQAHPDTVVHKYLNPPPAGSGGAVASAAGGTAGSLLGSAVKTVGGYAAGSLALKAAAKGVKWLAGKTPVGRLAKLGYAGYQVSKALKAGKQVKALPTAITIVKDLVL